MTQKLDGYFKSHDHHRLYYQSFKTKKPKAVVILVHGLNEHVGRYEHVVERLEQDYTVYLFDHRGHGRSDGVRSHVQKFTNYAKDLHEFIQIVSKENKGQKLFVIGHSMGGQVLLNYLHMFPKDGIHGFVTSSANIRVKIKINAIKRFVGLNLAKRLPKFKLPNEVNPKWISRDPVVVADYKKDPLVGKSLTASLAAEVIKNQDVIMDFAEDIKMPALMLHGGEDRICDVEGSKDFFGLLGSKDKELEIYPDMYHEIFNEIENEQVLDRVKTWLDQHC